MQYDRLLHHTQKCLRIICHALIVVVHTVQLPRSISWVAQWFCPAAGSEKASCLQCLLNDGSAVCLQCALMAHSTVSSNVCVFLLQG